MARKKRETQGDTPDAAHPAPGTTTTTADDAAAPTGPTVTVLKTATAPKLSPRGGGELTYQVGRIDNTVLLRIHKNDSSGRFSNEWVDLASIRRSLAQLPKGVSSFKGAVALRTAWRGQSSCNSGFGAAILRAERVFVNDPDPKKRGMLTLAAPGALDRWEASMLALPVPRDAERVPLHPPKAKPFFARKREGAAAADGAAADPADPVDAVDAVEPGDDADDAA